eukprot:13237168-Ditylum_brightwellii.AAC.1
MHNNTDILLPHSLLPSIPRTLIQTTILKSSMQRTFPPSVLIQSSTTDLIEPTCCTITIQPTE